MHFQSGNTDKPQVCLLLVLGECTHRLVTGEISTGLTHVCSITQNHRPFWQALIVPTWLVVGMLFFHRYFLGFPPPQAAAARSADGETYTDCTCSPGGRHCNKLGSQAPRIGMQFWPILQHCSKIIALLGDCRRTMTSR